MINLNKKQLLGNEQQYHIYEEEGLCSGRLISLEHWLDVVVGGEWLGMLCGGWCWLVRNVHSRLHDV